MSEVFVIFQLHLLLDFLELIKINCEISLACLIFLLEFIGCDRIILCRTMVVFAVVCKWNPFFGDQLLSRTGDIKLLLVANNVVT